MAKPSKSEIHELRDWLVQTYHKDRLREQEADQKYVDDDFNIEYLKEGIPKIATGKAYRMVSAPAEHIITSNPTLYREPKGKGELQAQRVGTEGNRWLKLMLRQNPQPLKEHVKKLLGKGESWIYLNHNDGFMPNDVNDMPVSFFVPDPTIVFVDPFGGEKNGVPQRLVVYTKRIAWQVREDYPFWKWQPKAGIQSWNSLVNFMMYFDNSYRYFEAEEEALFYETDKEGNPVVDKNSMAVPYGGDGVQENYYGFVPFVHCYSGFGEGAPDGNPVSLAVSRIRKCRDLIAEQTAIRSVLNHLIFEYAEPSMDLIYDPAIGTPSGDIGKEYSREPRAFNVMGLPTGATLTKGIDKLPDEQLFQHLFNIEKTIDEEDPLGKIGGAIGTSGRQQLDAEEGALRRYDTVVENSAHSWERAFGLALQLIEKIPSIKPDGLNKGDIGKYYDVRIELKAEDPQAKSIKSTDGDRKQIQGIVDHETNLIEYQGYTEDEAQEIIAKRMVDDVVMNDPVIRRLMAIQVAREMGMEQEYTAMEAQLAEMEKGLTERGLEAVPQTGSQGGEPRMGNIKTPKGREEMDMSLAQRPRRNRPI